MGGKKGFLKIKQTVRVAMMHHQQLAPKDSTWLIDSFRRDVPKPFNVFPLMFCNQIGTGDMYEPDLAGAP